ncbi:cytochrome P450 4C1 isoform X2 [Cephus cinctus]|uniref:Cytochrome P450 4C1 isoform X2 n=1 Tax=Cephus cinctus TaxID=211228 RepID=A0AAJ7CET0_CEPCN|nr:cytochrome P450 4C1 isoform X2 [Cephus cinctus]
MVLTISNCKDMISVTLIILIGVWLAKVILEWRNRRIRLIEFSKKLPGPPTLPLIGNALAFACSSTETLNVVTSLCNYGPIFRVWMGPKLFVAITDPRDYEVILTSPKASHKGAFYRFMKPFIGEGLVSGSGPTHRTHRKIIMPMLNVRVLEVFIQYFNEHSKYCANQLEEMVDTGEFDILPFTAHCAADITLETVMGIPGTVQRGGYKQLMHWAERMYEVIHTRIMKVWLHPEWIYSWTEYRAQEKIGQNVIQGFTESAIERKKKEHYALERGALISNRPRTMILEQLITYVENTHVMNDEELRDEIYTVFTAAQDTTGLVSAFALLLLGMHSDTQDKVRAELKDVVGTKDITMEMIPELKYLEMVIKETLRLFPIAPMFVRELTGDVELESCTLPKGCSVAMVPFVTHRSPKYWMEPEKFIPERFLPENSQNRHHYSFVPFSAGTRSCIGQKYAIMSMKIIIGTIVRKYQITAKGSMETIRLKTDISVRSVDGYKVSITRTT